MLLHTERRAPLHRTPTLGAALVEVRHALRDLLDIPGVVYACAADPAGPVVADVGTPDRGGETGAMLGWMLRAARDGGLEDIEVTSAHHYHVLRRFPVASRTLLVHLVLDRSGGNLALARRTLASGEFGARLDTAGRGRAAGGHRKSVWVGGTRPAPPQAAEAGTQPSPARTPARDGRGETSGSWLLLASLLAEQAAEPQAAERSSAA